MGFGRVVGTIVKDSGPLDLDHWEFAGIAPNSDRRGVGVVVDAKVEQK